jgi:hypothetical protein
MLIMGEKQNIGTLWKTEVGKWYGGAAVRGCGSKKALKAIEAIEALLIATSEFLNPHLNRAYC